MSSFKLLCLLGVVLCVAVANAVADVPVAIMTATPASAEALSAAASEYATSQLVAQRLRKIWPGRDVGVIGAVSADSTEDAHEMLHRMNSKYSVYDQYNIADTMGRHDIAKSADPEITVSGLSPVQDDYKSVINNANTREFNPKVDNPDNLEMMLSSLWGKRYGHMNTDQQEEAARNEKVLVIRGTSAESERMSQRISSDGSVHKFVTRPDDASTLAPPQVDAPFKPKQFWEGPRIYGTALDVTNQKAPQPGKRTPNDPPQPPVESFVFPDYVKTGTSADEAPITIIETIRVTRPGATRAKPTPEPTFTPVMTTDLKGPTKKAWRV